MAFKESTSPIDVQLENAEIWNRFAEHGTEMVVTKTGRRMFPTLRFRVSGLEPSATYAFLLELSPTDHCRYKFTSNGWAPSGRSLDLNTMPVRYAHPDGPAPGHIWMKQPVSFHKAKLTNNTADPCGNLLLSSLHRYQPRLLICRLHVSPLCPAQLVATVSFPETQFYAVTAYQNEKVIQLKIHHNPFAKGFRDSQKRRGCDPVESSDEEPSAKSSRPQPSPHSDVSSPCKAPDTPRATPEQAMPTPPCTIQPAFFPHAMPPMPYYPMVAPPPLYHPLFLNLVAHALSHPPHLS